MCFWLDVGRSLFLEAFWVGIQFGRHAFSSVSFPFTFVDFHSCFLMLFGFSCLDFFPPILFWKNWAHFRFFFIGRERNHEGHRYSEYIGRSKIANKSMSILTS